MLKLLFIGLTAAVTYYGLRASEVPALKRDMLALAHERDGLLKIVLRRSEKSLMARIRAEREEESNQYGVPLEPPVSPLDRLGCTYSLDEVLRGGF